MKSLRADLKIGMKTDWNCQ